MLEFREYEDKDYSSVVKLIKDSFDHDVTEINSDPNVYSLVGVLDGEVVSYLDITYCNIAFTYIIYFIIINRINFFFCSYIK